MRGRGTQRRGGRGKRKAIRQLKSCIRTEKERAGLKPGLYVWFHETMPRAQFWYWGSEELLQIFRGEIRVTENALEDFGMKSLGGVKRNGDALAGGVFVNHVAAALPGQRKSRLLQYGDDLAGREARKFGHQTATSTVERLTETRSGTSSPLARRSSMCRRMASLMFSTAAS